MSVRKEQVLALLTLVVALLVWNTHRQPLVMSSSIQMKELTYEGAKVTATPLAAASARAGSGRRDFATEPSETQPLPPRVLDLPRHAPITLVAVPLQPGPDYAHALVLAGDGEVVQGVTLQVAAESEAPAAPEANVQDAGPTTRAEREAIAARTYDRVYQAHQPAPLFGRVEVDGMDRFDLENLQNFAGVTIRLRTHDIDRNRSGRVITWDNQERVEIAKVVLADTLRNEITRRTRAVPSGPTTLPDRGRLIEWLLERAREDSSVYNDALAQAEQFLQDSGGDIEGLRWMQRVLQARGDLQGEYALLDGLPARHRESAFRYEGLGRLKARLGLFADAEQDLRKAVQLAPSDARPHAALAAFLHERGRSGEAVVAARRAQAAFGSLQDAGDKQRVARTVVTCQLAVADFDAAREALRLGGGTVSPYLDGAIHYAAGDVEAALNAFRRVSGLDSGPALLGQGACMIRQGKWQEAYDVLQRVVDQEPLLRHRACTGLALLMLRIGQFDGAIAWLDRAQEAAPLDPYAFYLRGAALRRQGNLDAAEEALRACLRERDDFVHALVEMGAVMSQRALEGGEATAAIAAMRYVERAVQLAFRPTVELYELLGRLRFFAGEPRAANTAFVTARDLAKEESGKLFAKGSMAVVDYSRGLREEAEAALQRMTLDLAKEDAMRVWAEATLAAIYDHGQKEMLGDGFERTELGRIWVDERDGGLGPTVKNGLLEFENPRSPNGREVTAKRANAVPRGKNFLAVACKVRLGALQPLGEGAGGLRIESQRGGGANQGLRAQVGFFEGRPHVVLEDGREEPVREYLQLGDVDVRQWQEVELRVQPRDNNFDLLVSWNGRVVFQQGLKSLMKNTSQPLETVLYAMGPKGSPVDFEFDDYRLERRRDSQQ